MVHVVLNSGAAYHGSAAAIAWVDNAALDFSENQTTAYPIVDPNLDVGTRFQHLEMTGARP